MSDNCREFLRDSLMLIGALALGLLVAWVVLKVQKPETPAGPLPRELHAQP